MTSDNYDPSVPPWLQNRDDDGGSSAPANPEPERDRVGPPPFAEPPQRYPSGPAEPYRPAAAPPYGQSTPPYGQPAPPYGQSAPAQPDSPPRPEPQTRAEITSDGKVVRVPFQEDPVAAKYQAPAQPEHDDAGYDWAPADPNRHPGGRPEEMPQSVDDLQLLKRARRAPSSGWRRAVHKASGGAINPGESPADLDHRDLVARVNQPVYGDYRIAVLSLKGGVGKTTTTVGLGSTFASVRGDRVIAIDANPDLGTLAHRVPRQTRSTVRTLLDQPNIARYSDVRAHTSQAPSRLEVLASEQDPAVSEAFSEADYRAAIAVLQQYYNIILTDCGTGLMHSAMSGVLDMASSLVLVTSPAIDGARSASATLDWLEHHGHGHLVERTVVVVNSSRGGANSVDVNQLRKLFLERTRAVQIVPFDEHLAEGAEIDLELVGKPTSRALLELAAMVADDFAPAAGRHHQH
ncbi:AAA family ATPase [Aldersonia sp. NBC_00410]|uniref:nucleotide-binding protein n=1 Tax=Aldersonia sp. NBC_00410 TaxID=2975954 RepID=UPI0022590096|nr:AAA family ATPase [Aldersonia sp. NBC_00410]MCX5043116.1 AAA family ATPase [Aldersonia sp. NBC_00410]